MEDNALEDEDIDFSMISPGNQKHKQFDSSVNDLLQNPKNSQLLKQIKTQPGCPDNSIKQQPKLEGSFMRDLQKMQHQISYQTNPYDIYERQQHAGQFTGTVQAKQQDTCTKTTNNMTNMTKIGQKNLENDFKHLIVDFSEERFSKIKNKECFEDYFETQILKTKKIDQKLEKQHSHKLIYLPVKIKKTKLVCVGGESKMKQTKSNSLKNSSSDKLLRKVKQANSPGLKKYSYKSPMAKSSSKSKSVSRSGQSTSRSKVNNKLSSKKKEEKQKNKRKKESNGNPIKSEVYSEYFGFPQQNSIHKKKKCNSSHSKGKKIIFSKKNVNAIR